jgi:hypothetical protein
MTSKMLNAKKTFYPTPTYYLTVLIIALFLMGTVSAKGTILFYETNRVSGNYKIDSGYSKFKEALVQKGYSVSKVETDISKPLLESYNPDVLVIAGLGSPLTATEQAAVFEFVMQKGRGLFICGGTDAANQLAIPFGMTIGDAPLEDETDPIKDVSTGEYVKDKGKFTLSYYENFIVDASTRSIIQGVSQLGFFGGKGISLSGSAKPILVGDMDTYAPKAQKILFPKGSRPPIAASAIVGKGLVFLLSDADMLLDTNLDSSKYRYDNLRFGTNIIDWLSIKREATENVSLDELQVIIGSLKQEISRLNDTITTLTKEKEKLTQEKLRLINELDNANKKIAEMEEQRFLGIQHWIWAVILLAVAIIVAAVVMAKKFKKLPEKISDLGYEFEEKPEEGEGGEEEALEIGGGKFEDFLEEKEGKEEIGIGGVKEEVEKKEKIK